MCLLMLNIFKVRRNLKPRSGVIFVTGKRDEFTSMTLMAENLKNGDILQGPITDSYQNLVYKTILGILCFEKLTPYKKQ